MKYVAPSAPRKRHLDEIAPPLSSDAPAIALPTKIPTHALPQLQQHHYEPRQQQQQQHYQQQHYQQYARPVYGSPPHPPLEFQDARMDFQPQLSPMVPLASSTPANAAPGRVRPGSFNQMDVQNKSPRKAPTKSRRLSIELDEHEFKTPVVLPGMNEHHDAYMGPRKDAPAGERAGDFWTPAQQAVPHAPGRGKPHKYEAGSDIPMIVAALVYPPAPASPLQYPQPQQPVEDQKESKASSALRVTKPVAMRGYKPSQPNPPLFVEPAALPSVSG